jgi:hypothetical protein
MVRPDGDDCEMKARGKENDGWAARGANVSTASASMVVCR